MGKKSDIDIFTRIASLSKYRIAEGYCDAGFRCYCCSSHKKGGMIIKFREEIRELWGVRAGMDLTYLCPKCSEVFRETFKEQMVLDVLSGKIKT